ncbi:MAG: glutathione synthase [Planctomycetota bacterium]
MRHLFVVDPLERLLPSADSTIAFMREAARRGHEVWAGTVDGLSLRPGSQPRAVARALELHEGDRWYTLDRSEEADVDAFDVAWMRKDPPIDLEYLYATHVLAFAEPRTLVVNAAHALREANEKLFVLRFPQLAPLTLVSRSVVELAAFRRELGGEMVVKPLGGAGGESVFHIRKDDPNASTILEVMTEHGRRFVMAQRYLEAIRHGDKRIVLVEGEPHGAVLRVPKAGEARANFHAGGRAVATTLTEREREICATLAPSLREMGIVFAGIDVIGDYLTEVNVTSPTGIREIAALDGVHIERAVLDAVEARRNQQSGV